jgi:hypothetical protein
MVGENTNHGEMECTRNGSALAMWRHSLLILKPVNPSGKTEAE